jgi:hypothetical protein
VLGAQRTPYLQAGEWQLGASYRYQQSRKFFSGTEEATGAPEVRRTQHIIDVGATYALDQQTNLTLNVPFVDLNFGLGLPPPGGSIDSVHTSGIGDVSLVARRWLLNCPSHPNGNISLGFGLSFPTGNDEARDRFTDPNGVRRLRPVDISSQPGSGGLGLVFDLQAFQRAGDATVFLSGSYLAQPKDTNDTLSLPSGLMGPQNTPARIRFNSVPDQYVGVLGAAVPIKRVPGLSLSFAGRIAGIPTEDFLGDSDGFRFAGYGVYVEPGISYTRGASTWAISAPVKVHQNAQDVPATPGPDIATFAPYQIIVSYSRRIGR